MTGSRRETSAARPVDSWLTATVLSERVTGKADYVGKFGDKTFNGRMAPRGHGLRPVVRPSPGKPSVRQTVEDDSDTDLNAVWKRCSMDGGVTRLTLPGDPFQVRFLFSFSKTTPISRELGCEVHIDRLLNSPQRSEAG